MKDRMTIVVAAVALAAACKPAGERDQRSPNDLARAFEEAKMGAVASDRDPFAEMVAEWAKRRVRWSMRYLPALCPRPRSCRLLPFDGRKSSAPPHGWLVTAALDDQGHARLKAACRPHARCVVELAGGLDLRLTAGLPPQVTLTNPSVVGARAVAPGEAWVRRGPVAADGRR